MFKELNYSMNLYFYPLLSIKPFYKISLLMLRVLAMRGSLPPAAHIMLTNSRFLAWHLLRVSIKTSVHRLAQLKCAAGYCFPAQLCSCGGTREFSSLCSLHYCVWKDKRATCMMRESCCALLKRPATRNFSPFSSSAHTLVGVSTRSAAQHCVSICSASEMEKQRNV
jgi:hypothetical protein